MAETSKSGDARPFDCSPWAKCRAGRLGERRCDMCGKRRVFSVRGSPLRPAAIRDIVLATLGYKTDVWFRQVDETMYVTVGCMLLIELKFLGRLLEGSWHNVPFAT